MVAVRYHGCTIERHNIPEYIDLSDSNDQGGRANTTLQRHLKQNQCGCSATLSTYDQELETIEFCKLYGWGVSLGYPLYIFILVFVGIVVVHSLPLYAESSKCIDIHCVL